MTARDACAHCARPREQHGRRYAALPGWHDWTRETPRPMAYAGWIFPSGTVVRPAPPGVLADNTNQET